MGCDLLEQKKNSEIIFQNSECGRIKGIRMELNGRSVIILRMWKGTEWRGRGKENERRNEVVQRGQRRRLCNQEQEFKFVISNFKTRSSKRSRAETDSTTNNQTNRHLKQR